MTNMRRKPPRSTQFRGASAARDAAIEAQARAAGRGARSAQQPQFMEGMTATNPKTRERLIFRNGKWMRLR